MGPGIETIAGPERPPVPPEAFEIAKWYFDCVTPEGHVFIGYLGHLRWKSLAVHFQSALVHRNRDGTRETFSWRRGTPPHIQQNSVQWNSKALRISGAWSALESSVETRIFESQEGNVDWQCVQPRARATVRIGTAKGLHGFGYAEHLRLTIPPWRMPLKELRWGRFLSESESVVWIDWRGGYSRRIVLLDGCQVQAEKITDRQVVFEGNEAVLDLDEICVLREGTLAEGALHIPRKLTALLPFQALSIHECKWRSRGVLRRGNAAPSTGWAIHEVVQWT